MQEPTVQDQIDAIELSIAAAKEKVALGDATNRLFKNKDFKKVVLDHFMKDDVSRTVKALADPSCQAQQHQDALFKRIQAVGQVDQFLRMTVMMGDLAKKALEDDNAAIAELNSEVE